MIENFELNKELFFWINNFAGKSQFLDWLFIFMSEYLIFLIGILFFVYFINQIFEDNKVELKELFVYFFASISTWWLVLLMKIFIDAERPFSYFKIETLETHSNVFASFPSGHSSVAFALAMSVYIYNRQIGIFLLFLALFVALGRVLVGVHYPLDIFVGSVIGLFIPLTAGLFLKKKL